jgi:outer membrane protein assembly factor BamB
VNSLAFSPDGTKLATGAGDRARIWDAATGQSILEFPHSQSVTSLAFSADGQRLALVTQPPTHVFIYELQDGRGIFVLRGLAGRLSALAFSRDGSTVAALNQNWQLAVWDARSGQCRHMIDVKSFGSAVNAALIFSDDGRRLALAANQQARSWDLDTGRETGAWRLPEGQSNCLIFGNAGELLLFRVEADADGQPIGRIRNLHGVDPLTPCGETRDFNLHLFGVVAAPEARQLIIDGTGNATGEPRRMVQGIDARTGRLVWTIDSKRSALDGQIAVDSGGKSAALRLGNDRRHGLLLQIADGQAIRPLPHVPIAFNQDANLAVSLHAHASRRGLTELRLGRLDREETLAILETETPAACAAVFDGSGRRLVWSRPDGVVLLCDLETSRVRLASLGLGW